MQPKSLDIDGSIVLVYNYFRMFISIHIKQGNRNLCRESGPDNGIL